MFGPNPFAVPVSSFGRPVPPVFVDPDDNPNYQVCFRSEWLPYILGSLEQLLLQTTWKSDDPLIIQQTQDRARLLLSLFMRGCPTVVPDFGCVVFPMSASFISYYPQNPYTMPGYVPDWYSITPFLRVDSDLAATLTGTAINDVVALNGAFPNPDAIAEKGLSAIHIELIGVGQVELHFVGLFAGALAAVTVDGDGLATTYVDLNVDVIELPPESYGEIIKEYEFTTDGPHHIDVRFTPVVDDSGIPLRYGGGMRSVVLCGFDAIPGDTLFDVRQNTENPCTLEKSINAGETWTAWADLKLCPPDLILDGGILKIKRGGVYIPVDGTGSYDERQDGTYTPPWPTGTVPSGQTGNCLAAENIVAFFASSLTQVKQGLDIGTPVSTTMGIVAGTIGFLGLISAGVFAAVGLIIAGLLSALGSAGINDMLTDDTLHKFKCAIEENAEADGSVTAADYNAIYSRVGTTIEGVKGEIIQNWLNGFGPVGLSRQGKVNDITTGDCADCGACTVVLIEGTRYPMDSGQTITQDGCHWTVVASTDPSSGHSLLQIKSSTGASFYIIDGAGFDSEYSEWHKDTGTVINGGVVGCGNELILAWTTAGSRTVSFTLVDC